MEVIGETYEQEDIELILPTHSSPLFDINFDINPI
ncbi:hypothetical protein CRD_00122 [Raphidiopsis brookii D9]|nr:hypothetical protein CRD_00122 [Raphidiopsis brookii D9]